MKKLILITILLFAVNLVWAQWEPDVRLTIDPYVSENYSQNGIASSGDSVHVVWDDNRDGNYEIYYKLSIDGGLTWGEDIRLTDNNSESFNASIALSGSGVHVGWVDDRDGNYELYYKRSPDGGINWGEDTRLTNTAGLSSSCGIAASGSMIYLAYHDNSVGNWEIYYKRSINGGVTWEPEVRLTNDPASSLNPKFYTSGSVVHVVWNDDRDGNREIYYKRSTDNGMTWEADTRLTNNDSISWLPCVGASGSDVYVVWDDNRDGNSEIYFKHSADGGLTWGEDYRLTNNSGESEYPNIAVSGTCIFVVWNDDSDGNREIYYKRSTDRGITWGPDIRLTNDPAESRYSCLSISGSQVHVVWSDYRDGNYEIYYKRDPTGGFPVGIDNELTGTSGQPISIYPNPTGSVLNIDYSPAFVSTLALRIIDNKGQTVGIYNFNSPQGLNHYSIDLNDFISGLYFIEFTTGGKKQSEKLLINK